MDVKYFFPFPNCEICFSIPGGVGGDYTALPSFLVKQLLIKEKVYSTTLLAQLGYSEIKSSHF